jgi:hypothetical protein
VKTKHPLSIFGFLGLDTERVLYFNLLIVNTLRSIIRTCVKTHNIKDIGLKTLASLLLLGFGRHLTSGKLGLNDARPVYKVDDVENRVLYLDKKQLLVFEAKASK